MRTGIGGSQAEDSCWSKPGEASGRGAEGCSGEGRLHGVQSVVVRRCVVHPSGGASLWRSPTQSLMSSPHLPMLPRAYVFRWCGNQEEASVHMCVVSPVSPTEAVTRKKGVPSKWLPTLASQAWKAPKQAGHGKAWS